MSQQGQWKASSLAATFSSNAGFNGTSWGAARPALHMGNEIGFGMGFAQTPVINNMLLSAYNYSAGGAQAHGGAERPQKRKASGEDERMESSSPSPSPEMAAVSVPRKIRASGDSRRTRQLMQQRHAGAASASSSNAGAAGKGAASALGHQVGDGSFESRKRTRVQEETAAPGEVSLDKLIEPLEERGLRLLLETLISQNPQLASQVRQLVPKPTISSACSQLVRLERRLQAAFPYNKSGPVSDDYAYHRVRPALEELRDTIVMYLDHFTHYGLASNRDETGAGKQSNVLAHPAEWFDLLAQATDVAVRMPKWDKAEYNNIRRDTLRQLADGWTRAIMATARWTEEGHIVGRDMLSQWAQQLDHFYSASGESQLFEPATQAFGRSFGQHYPRLAFGRTSLHSAT
ncbi:Tethering factor for nuclear proteasome sts1 [Coemansia sp. Benny D115]|nr:Tethering factor for nuclear proteasome sts1 [Coemansia sp. Benny D115]